MNRIFNLKFSIFNKKGFSLIELLISITIIGILSSVVLSSVSNSRARAFDTKIKQQLSRFRTAAEIYFTNHSDTYGPATSLCSEGLFNDFTTSNGTPGVYIAAGNLPDFAQVVCSATDVAYAVKVSLYSGNESWCVDSKGASRLISGPIGAPVTICP